MGTTHVRWTTRYRYLGCELTATLDSRAALSHVASALESAWAATFATNGVLRASPPALILEAFNTCVLGVGNYLMSLLTPTDAMRKAFTKVCKRAASVALRSGSSAPASVLYADARMPLLDGIVARESTRLLMQLQTSVFKDTALAPRLIPVLEAQGRDLRDGMRSWLHTTRDAMMAWRARLGVAPPRAELPGLMVTRSATGAMLVVATPTRRRRTPSRTGNIHQEVLHPSCAATHAASVYGRAVSFETWRMTSIAGTNSLRPANGLPAVAAFVRPTQLPTAPPTAHAAALHFNYAIRHGALGMQKGCTPLSALGPGASGGLLSLVTDATMPASLLRCLSHLRGGRKALFQKGIAPPCLLYPAELLDRTQGLDDDLRNTRWHRAAQGGRAAVTCPLCQSTGALGPAHVLCDCLHPDVAAARLSWQLQMPSRIFALAMGLFMGQARAARGGNPRIPLGDVAMEDCRLKAANVRSVAETAFNEGHRHSADAQFCAFRLMMAMPWPGSLRGAPRGGLTQTLGQLFDNTSAANLYFRATVNKWVRWAGRACTSILSAWSHGVQREWMRMGGPEEDSACFRLDASCGGMPPSWRALCGLETERQPRAATLRAAMLAEADADVHGLRRRRR
jgi:hypothetical protein